MQKSLYRDVAVAAVLGWTVAAAPASAAPPSYRIVSLTLPANAASSTAIAINARGDVAGNLNLVGGGSVAALWLLGSGAPQTLAPPPGFVGGFVDAINDSGMAVGSAMTSSGSSVAIRWSNGNPGITLDTMPKSTGSYAAGVNNAGVAVGQSNKRSNSSLPVLWTVDGSVSDISARAGRAFGINDSGLIVGRKGSGKTSTTHAFVTSPQGALKALPELPGGVGGGTAYAINASGQIVGSGSGTPAGGVQTFACLWDPAGQVQSLGTLPSNAFEYQAVAINGVGTVVGSSYLEPNGVIPFWWTAMTGMLKLVDLIDPTDPLLPAARSSLVVYAVNDNGIVVGSLTPVGAIGTQAVMLVPE